jgi:hypothetical protein
LMESTINATYYVHISDRFPGSSRQFSLSVTAYMQPMNDECATAEDLAIDAAPIRGTIRLVTTEGETPLTPCGFAMAYNRSGMAWYTVTPTENATLRASTCSARTAMFTGITVVVGGCDEQVCVAASNPDLRYEGCGYAGGFVDFDVVADGSSYSIFVWGSIFGDLGFFELERMIAARSLLVLLLMNPISLELCLMRHRH